MSHAPRHRRATPLSLRSRRAGHPSALLSLSNTAPPCPPAADPNSSLRFAFIEFTSEEAIPNALQKSGSVLGEVPIRCMPSKTAIVPVNNQYLPQNEDEREQVGGGLGLLPQPPAAAGVRGGVCPLCRCLPQPSPPLPCLLQCERTVYVASIDKRVEKLDVKTFFESICGPISRLRLLGDAHHNHRSVNLAA